ncbi:MAG: leucyl aminopeptidase family protein [Alphaproteobacteria bacterium]|nr:leucyl aminopeptidase family protein [Alphaproteobacteria bacterium]
MNDSLLKPHEPAARAAATPIFRIAEKDEAAIANLPEPLAALARANRFAGEAGAVLAAREGVLLGVGDGSDPFVAAACAERLPEGDYYFKEKMESAEARRATLGWALGGYRFDRYKKQKPAEARLIAPEGVDIADVKRIAGAVALVRDLVNTPAGDMSPVALEDETRKLAARFNADVEVIAGGELLSRNFPMIHAVGRAAAAAPRLIDLKWGRPDAPKVTLIGKGVCFDSGGLDIKTSASMLIMKKDMGGAANALGLARLAMEAGLDIRLRVLIPAVENAISGAAYRPGDILKSRKGLTVEIGNTDAEGRLVLADAMAYGAEDKPEMMITLATLTGAARVALGPDLPAFYTDDEDFAAAMARASEESADPVWRMPLWGPYDSMLSSPIADVNNVSGNSFAGSVIAALFLKRFAPSAGAWAHFDIFAWRPKAAPGRPAGGEAQAIRALYRLIEARYGRA